MRPHDRCPRIGTAIPKPAYLVISLALFGLLLGNCAASLAATTLYVDPNGNDAWSGSLQQPNASGTDGPLASLAGARNAVRRLKDGRKLDSPVQVLFASGDYPITEPVAFTPLDCGTADAPIIYTAAPGAKPVIHGGRKITGFKPGPDGVWTAQVPDVASGKMELRATLDQRQAGDPGTRTRQVLLLHDKEDCQRNRSADGRAREPAEPGLWCPRSRYGAAAGNSQGAADRRAPGRLPFVGNRGPSCRGRRSGDACDRHHRPGRWPFFVGAQHNVITSKDITPHWMNRASGA